MAKVYDLQLKLNQGRQSERRLFELLTKCAPQFNAKVRSSSRMEERMGYDFVIEDERGSGRCTVELKTDWRAETSGNAFLETYSALETKTLGWVYTSKSDFLLYVLPNLGRGFCLRVGDIMDYIDAHPHLPTKKIPNRNGKSRYTTVGVLLDLDILWESLSVDACSLNSTSLALFFERTIAPALAARRAAIQLC